MGFLSYGISNLQNFKMFSSGGCEILVLALEK